MLLLLIQEASAWLAISQRLQRLGQSLDQLACRDLVRDLSKIMGEKECLAFLSQYVSVKPQSLASVDFKKLVRGYDVNLTRESIRSPAVSDLKELSACYNVNLTREIIRKIEVLFYQLYMDLSVTIEETV